MSELRDARIILCMPCLYEYKGIMFGTVGTGAPYWPIKRDTWYPYERLTKAMWATLEELCEMSSETREKYRRIGRSHTSRMMANGIMNRDNDER